jgi:flagellar hook-length control protein FliK
VDSSVLAVGIPMAAPQARSQGPSPRRSGDDAFGEMLGLRLRDDGPAREPSNTEAADHASPQSLSETGARTAPARAVAPARTAVPARTAAPSPRRESASADADAVDRTGDAGPKQPIGEGGPSQEQPVDREDKIDRAADPALAAPMGFANPTPQANAAPPPEQPPDWPAGLSDTASESAEGTEVPSDDDPAYATADAVESPTPGDVAPLQDAGVLPGIGAPAAPPQLPGLEVRVDEGQDVPDRRDDAPEPPATRRLPGVPLAASADRPPVMSAAVPDGSAPFAVVRRAEALSARREDPASADPEGRPAPMFEGVIDARPDVARDAATSPTVPPAVVLDAMRGAKLTVSQVQLPQAQPALTVAVSTQAAVLPDEAAAMLQESAAAASIVPILKAYERQSGAARAGEVSGDVAGRGSGLLGAALGIMSRAAGGDAPESDSSAGHGTRRGVPTPLAQAAVAFARATVGPESSWALSMAAGPRPEGGTELEDPAAESPVNGPSLTRSLVQTVRVQVRQGGGEAHIRLNPEELGELSVLVKVDGTGVSATLRAESPLVRSWIEAHQQELKAALKEQGLSLDDLVIDADGRSGQQADAQAQQQRHATPRRPAAGLQFEALI